MTLRILISAAIAVVAAAIGIEIRSWLKGTRLISKYQKGYRLAAALVLEAVLFMILFGGAVAARHNPLLVICYWTAAMALSFALVALALLDVRATLASYTEHRKEMFKGLLDEERREE